MRVFQLLFGAVAAAATRGGADTDADMTVVEDRGVQIESESGAIASLATEQLLAKKKAAVSELIQSRFQQMEEEAKLQELGPKYTQEVAGLVQGAMDEINRASADAEHLYTELERVFKAAVGELVQKYDVLVDADMQALQHGLASLETFVAEETAGEFKELDDTARLLLIDFATPKGTAKCCCDGNACTVQKGSCTTGQPHYETSTDVEEIQRRAQKCLEAARGTWKFSDLTEPAPLPKATAAAVPETFMQTGMSFLQRHDFSK